MDILKLSIYIWLAELLLGSLTLATALWLVFGQEIQDIRSWGAMAGATIVLGSSALLYVGLELKKAAAILTHCGLQFLAVFGDLCGIAACVVFMASGVYKFVAGIAVLLIVAAHVQSFCLYIMWQLFLSFRDREGTRPEPAVELVEPEDMHGIDI